MHVNREQCLPQACKRGDTGRGACKVLGMKALVRTGSGAWLHRLAGAAQREGACLRLRQGGAKCNLENRAYVGLLKTILPCGKFSRFCDRAGGAVMPCELPCFSKWCRICVMTWFPAGPVVCACSGLSTCTISHVRVSGGLLWWQHALCGMFGRCFCLF